MRSGDLRHNIVIQERASTADGMGGEVITWSDLYPCRAAIWPVKSSEQLDAMKLELRNVERVRIRHPRMINITADMRIIHNNCFCEADETLNIISIIDQDRRRNQLDFLTTRDA